MKSLLFRLQIRKLIVIQTTFQAVSRGIFAVINQYRRVIFFSQKEFLPCSFEPIDEGLLWLSYSGIGDKMIVQIKMIINSCIAEKKTKHKHFTKIFIYLMSKSNSERGDSTFLPPSPSPQPFRVVENATAKEIYVEKKII